MGKTARGPGDCLGPVPASDIDLSADINAPVRAAASGSLLISQQDLHAVPHRVDEQVNLAAHWNAHVAPTSA